MSRSMSHAQLTELMSRIADKFSPFKTRMNSAGHSIPAIKYVHPNFDNRFGGYFSITLRTMGGREELFHTQNECRDLKESLFERVNKFLDELEA